MATYVILCQLAGKTVTYLYADPVKALRKATALIRGGTKVQITDDRDQPISLEHLQRMAATP